MNKFLKALALVLGLGLISINTQAAVIVTPKILVHSSSKQAVGHDKWFASCKYAESDVIPEGFGCDINGKVISITDLAESKNLNISRLKAYKHKNIFTGNVTVFIEEIR